MSETSNDYASDDPSSDDIFSDADDLPFNRKFLNMDQSTCWLNSCMQLILTGLDYHEQCNVFFSELGLKLLQLKSQFGKNYLDATDVKAILVEAEDTRIATRISTLTETIKEQDVLHRRVRNLENLRLNLLSGEQCCRDFFLCLGENATSWPDVHKCFSFNLEQLTTCGSCNHKNASDNNQFYIELDVPAEGSSLNSPVEDYLNSASLVGTFCTYCKKDVQVEIRNQINDIEETEFITVILRRGESEGIELNKEKVNATNDVFIR